GSVVWAEPYQPAMISTAPSGIMTPPATASQRWVTTSWARRRSRDRLAASSDWAPVLVAGAARPAWAAEAWAAALADRAWPVEALWKAVTAGPRPGDRRPPGGRGRRPPGGGSRGRACPRPPG